LYCHVEESADLLMDLDGQTSPWVSSLSFFSNQSRLVHAPSSTIQDCGCPVSPN
jgi:hypothetical protein